MPQASLVLWVDSNKNQLLTGWNSSATATTPVLKQGDSASIELHWVKSNIGGFSEEILWSPSTEITLAIGAIQTAPTDGTFTLKWNGSPSTTLAYNSTAQQVQDALNALIGSNAVVVTKTTTSYRIVWNTAGDITGTLEVGDNDLYPTSSIMVLQGRQGTSAVREIRQIQIKQSPIAMTNTWVNQDSCVGTVSVIKASNYNGDTRIWRVKLSPAPKVGTFILSYNFNSIVKTTAQISVSATIAEIKSALDKVQEVDSSGVPVSNWSVIQSGDYCWDISTTVTASALTINAIGILSFSSKYGIISMNNVEVENYLAGKSSASAVLEIEVVADGSRQTLIQTAVTIVNDLIDEADYTIIPREEVMPIDSVVRYDTSQGLTNEQKATARNNIGAYGSDAVQLQDLILTVAGIENRVGYIETNDVTVNQKNALTAGSSPSAFNAFITASALNDKLVAEYAPLGHTQELATIIGLQESLDLKAGITHTHPISDIIDLQSNLDAIGTSLDNKSDVTHTHDTLLSEDIYSAIVFSGLSGQSNNYAISTSVLESYKTTVTSNLNLKANLQSPTFQNGITLSNGDVTINGSTRGVYLPSDGRVVFDTNTSTNPSTSYIQFSNGSQQFSAYTTENPTFTGSLKLTKDDSFGYGIEIVSTENHYSGSTLRVLNKGTGHTAVFEDSTPDGTPTIIDKDGHIGIGVAPDGTICLAVDATGIKFADGTVQTSASYATGTNASTFNGGIITNALNINTNSTVVPLNIGAGKVPSGAGVAGDVWIGTTNLAWKDSTNATRTAVTTSGSNTFTNNNVIDTTSATLPALTVKQSGNGGGLLVQNPSGTGYSFKVEDAVSDTTTFIIDQNGRVGIGVANADTTVALTVDSTGIKFSDATIQTTAGSISKATNGWSKMPNGMIMQWGTTSAVSFGAGSTITFPTAFTTACANVTATLQHGTANTTSGEAGAVWVKTFTTTNFIVQTNITASSTASTGVVYWQAIGY